jgi:hypothetical protein
MEGKEDRDKQGGRLGREHVSKSMSAISGRDRRGTDILGSGTLSATQSLHSWVTASGRSGYQQVGKEEHQVPKPNRPPPT